MANSLPPGVELPVGFRFYPTDEELVDFYLKNKVSGNESLVENIRQIDTCQYEPSDLPWLLNDDTGIEKWFFFSTLDFRSPNGHRVKRTTNTGFWKSTGNDRNIKARGTSKLIGTKKTLVFHRGHGRNSNRTNWVIHEYRLVDSDTSSANPVPFVICRLKRKSDKSVSIFDEPNGLVNSTVENVGPSNRIPEASGHDSSHLQSSLCFGNSTGQPALPDFQSINASDGGVNRQPIQPEANENYFNFFELLNMCYSPQQPTLTDFQPINASESGECFDDASSRMCRFPLSSEPKPALMDVQPANDNVGEVNNQLSRPGASESEIGLANFLNSLLENENNDEVTSTIYIDSHDNEELSNMLLDPQYGLSSDTDNDAAFVWQNNHISPSCYYKCTSSAMQNVQTIKKSLRSHLPVKSFQYREVKEEKEIYPRQVLQLQGSSCGSIVSTRNVFSYIITTKRIQHKSSHPLVYFAKAFLGIILFVVLAQEVLLYGY